MRPASGLRAALADGYDAAALSADVLAGLTVGVVALPLSMALAIASGVPPQHGLYTAIVAGFVIALLGGSRVQVSGPTAAFVVLLAPVSAAWGLAGLALASAMAGVLLVALGLLRLGRLLEFVPYPVTTGFTAGIAVVIATLQVKDFLGLTVVLPEHWHERVWALATALPTASPVDAAIGGGTLAVLLLWPRLSHRLPAPLVALALAAGVAAALHAFAPELEPATLGSRFSTVVDGVTVAGIPRLPPLPGLPWDLPGPDGRPLVLSWDLLGTLARPALAIALLGAIESLLSAVVADGMTGHRHDPDAELVAQGVGNVVAPFFGGFAATGAIARTATNIRSGARSPIAAMVHALFVLAAMWALAPLLAWLPMAALAALLLLVAWNMSDARHALRTVRTAPRSDVAVLLVCFALTVTTDMVVAVGVGIVLAALLFMRRMAEVTGARLVRGDDLGADHDVPHDVVVYAVDGPLFFGAAVKAMAALPVVGPARVVLVDLRAVPAIDATGLVALQSALGQIRRGGGRVVLAGVQPQPGRALARAGIGGDGVDVVEDWAEALRRVRGQGPVTP